VLLKPSKRTQGREMNRKRRIASALALAGFLCMSTSSTTVAASPQLSGYGGPGAGEQTILGSTLLGRRGGGSAPGGSAGSGGPTQAGGAGSAVGGAENPTTRRYGGASNSGSSEASGSSTGGTSASGTGGSPATTHGAQQAGGKARLPGRASVAGIYVYPSSLRLASSDSSALAISGGDVLLLMAVVIAIVLVGVLTMRLGRLQR
jgi:hypothetical protein